MYEPKVKMLCIKIYRHSKNSTSINGLYYTYRVQKNFDTMHHIDIHFMVAKHVEHFLNDNNIDCPYGYHVDYNFIDC
jgi:hypothetical protein